MAKLVRKIAQADAFWAGSKAIKLHKLGSMSRSRAARISSSDNTSRPG
jgi:hypothetical protein